MKQSLIVAASAFALSAAGIASFAVVTPLGAEASAQALQSRTATFAIQNMTCPLCPVTVKRAIASVTGVRSVQVDFKAKMARVSFDPSRTTPAAIARASTNAGYPAHVTKV